MRASGLRLSICFVLMACFSVSGCSSGVQRTVDAGSEEVPDVADQEAVNACGPGEEPHDWEHTLSPSHMFGGEWQIVPSDSVVAAGLPQFDPKDPGELPYGPAERLQGPPFGQSRAGATTFYGTRRLMLASYAEALTGSDLIIQWAGSDPWVHTVIAIRRDGGVVLITEPCDTPLDDMFVSYADARVGSGPYSSVAEFALALTSPESQAAELRALEDLPNPTALPDTQTPADVWLAAEPGERAVLPGVTPQDVMSSLEARSVEVEIPASWVGQDAFLCVRSSVGYGPACLPLADKDLVTEMTPSVLDVYAYPDHPVEVVVRSSFSLTVDAHLATVATVASTDFEDSRVSLVAIAPDLTWDQTVNTERPTLRAK